MSSLAQKTASVRGIEVAYLTGGEGPPLVFWHGAGTLPGFDFAQAWTKDFQVCLPFHVGFGPSGDDETISDMQDYILHYLDLFDELGLDRFHLVGHSMGGWMAARFAAQYPERVDRLVLACPAGLRVKDFPLTDLFRLRPDQVVGVLTEKPDVILSRLPKEMTFDFAVQGYREQTSLARIAWETPYDRKLPRWLHRIKAPTLILWGTKDRTIPVGQAEAWHDLIGHAEIVRFDGVGHLVFNEEPKIVAKTAEFLAA